MDIGQPEVSTRITVGELLMIDPQLVEDGSMEIVKMNPVFRRVVAILISSAILDPRLDPAPGEEHGIGVGIVIPSITPLGHGGPAELATP